MTLNVALNQGGVEYQGGGTHFIRQKCVMRDLEPGWGTLSPGRLTHYHEGLEVTSGTRCVRGGTANQPFARVVMSYGLSLPPSPPPVRLLTVLADCSVPSLHMQLYPGEWI